MTPRGSRGDRAGAERPPRARPHQLAFARRCAKTRAGHTDTQQPTVLPQCHPVKSRGGTQHDGWGAGREDPLTQGRWGRKAAPSPWTPLSLCPTKGNSPESARGGPRCPRLQAAGWTRALRPAGGRAPPTPAPGSLQVSSDVPLPLARGDTGSMTPQASQRAPGRRDGPGTGSPAGFVKGRFPQGKSRKLVSHSGHRTGTPAAQCVVLIQSLM